jgi:hypothetical protein
MARFSTAAKALRGPFKKLVAKLALKLKKVLIKSPGKRSYPASGPRKVIERDLRDPSSLRGATPDEVRRLIPEDWVERPLRKGDGVRFLDQRRKGDAVEIEPGVPGHLDLVHRGPYVKVSRNGKVERIPLQGNPMLGD